MIAAFSDHVALLQHFLSRRADVVDRIESLLLNVRGKDTARSRDRRHFDQLLNTGFFGLAGLPRECSKLKGHLAARHLADGFEPLVLERFPNELDPLELVVRAYDLWDRQRWPGKSGRLTYAQTIYVVFMLRQLELLSLTTCDEGDAQAPDRLRDVQRLLDQLNEPAVPSAFVRDASWLMQTAQGPVTRHLAPYFTVADRISRAFPLAGRLGFHKAGARLGGGHLRSQLRYRAWQSGRPMDDPESLAFTRNSNSMDNALLVRDLVPLLEGYALACDRGDAEERLDLADAVLQGLSADPDLFVTRLDLLTPCTMIEDLSVECGDDGRVRYTAGGGAHVAMLARYRELVGRFAESLRQDAFAFDPAHQVYSPHGIAYGFCADVMANMAMDTLVSQPSFGLSLEDVFVSRGRLDDKLARASGWRALPIRSGEREHFDHSIDAAAESFRRLMRALEARSARPFEPNASSFPERRLFVVPDSVSIDTLPDGTFPAAVANADEHCFTSDWQRALSTTMTGVPKARLLADRAEGRFLASVESDGRWIGVSKVVPTLFMGQGRDAVVTGMPLLLIDVLRLTCPGLVVACQAAPREEVAREVSPMSTARDTAFEMAVSSVRFGVGVTREVGMDLKEMGAGLVLVLTDDRVRLLPPARTVLGSLDEQRVPFVLFDRVRVEPTEESFLEAIAFARAHPFDAIVAVGGGSTIDTAKAVNLYTTYPPADFLDYVNPPIGKGVPVPGPLKPLMAIPTTAGTGSETTGVSIFDLTRLHAKTGIANRRLKPTLGYLDPDNTRTMPPEVAASTGLDILSHAIESYTALPYTERPRPERPALRPAYQGSNPISDIWAIQALRMVAQFLVRAVEDPADDEARANMLLAASYAGVGFGNAGVHLPHGMSYPVSGHVRSYHAPGYPDDHPLVPHGVSVILNAPAVFRFTASANPARHLEAAEALGADITGVRQADAGKVLADRLTRFMQRLKLPNGLRAIGYTTADIPTLVEGTLPQHRVTKLSPRAAGPDELAALFEDAMVAW